MWQPNNGMGRIPQGTRTPTLSLREGSAPGPTFGPCPMTSELLPDPALLHAVAALAREPVYSRRHYHEVPKVPPPGADLTPEEQRNPETPQQPEAGLRRPRVTLVAGARPRTTGADARGACARGL